MGHGPPPTGRLRRARRPAVAAASTSSRASRARCSRRCVRRSSTSGSVRFTDTPDEPFAPTLTHRDVLEFATIDGARACATRRQGRLAHTGQAGRHRPAERQRDQHDADGRPDRDDRRLLRHVERRLGLRRRARGEARRRARRRRSQARSSSSSTSRGTTSSEAAGCCPSGRPRRRQRSRSDLARARSAIGPGSTRPDERREQWEAASSSSAGRRVSAASSRSPTPTKVVT